MASPAPDTPKTEPPMVEDSTDGELQSAATHKCSLVPVITDTEIKHFHELGLGRGIDSTVDNMWKNKSPIQIRTIAKDLSNVIGTDEMNSKHRYSKYVSSVKTQQAKIQASLNEPTSHVKIGLDAHYSRSSSQTVEIRGVKIQTRTISFRYDFEDIPGESLDDLPLSLIETEPAEDVTFLNDMATWILIKLEGVQKDPARTWEQPEVAKLQGKNAMEKLAKFSESVTNVTSPQAFALGSVTRDIIFSFGITHYVSSIELGALKYSVSKSSSTTTNKGGGANLGVGSTASTSGSVDTTHTHTERSKNEQTIGSFDKEGIVERNTLDEAVIGFQLEPLNRLIRIPTVALAIQVAIKRYLESKTDDSIGPFLISTKIDDNRVFWKVNQDSGNLFGTDDVKESSLFYIRPTDDKYAPSEFAIAYWGDQKTDRKLITSVDDELSKLRKIVPKVPRFLTAKASFFVPDGPLRFKIAFDGNDARFTLHSRVHFSFACFTRLAPPTSLQTWLEGDEFYIKHYTGVLERSEFVAFQQNAQAPSVQAGYTSTIVNSIKDPAKNRIGMLFRLHPFEFRGSARDQDTGSLLDTVKQQLS